MDRQQLCASIQITRSAGRLWTMHGVCGLLTQPRSHADSATHPTWLCLACCLRCSCGAVLACPWWRSSCPTCACPRCCLRHRCCCCCVDAPGLAPPDRLRPAWQATVAVVLRGANCASPVFFCSSLASHLGSCLAPTQFFLLLFLLLLHFLFLPLYDEAAPEYVPIPL